MPLGPLFVLGMIVGLVLGGVYGVSIGNVAFSLPKGALLGLIIDAIMNKAGNDPE